MSSYHVLAVLPRGPYFPGLSSNLAPENAGEPAALDLLEKSLAALHAGRIDEARHLALAACPLSARIRPVAQSIAAVADIKISESQQLERARRLADLLGRFFTQLEQMTLEALHEPRVTLALLRNYAESIQPFEELYRARLERLLLEQYEQCGSDTGRIRLLEIARRFSIVPHAEAYAMAANLEHARPAIADFWSAVRRNEPEAARLALRNASRFLSTELELEKTVLDDLLRSHTRLTSQLTEPGLQDVGRILEFLDKGELEQTEQFLKNLMVGQSAPDCEIELDSKVQAAERVKQAHEAVTKGDEIAAVEKLKQAITGDSTNQHALALLLTLETRASSLTGSDRQRGTDAGVSAIQAFLDGNALECRAACDRLDAILKGSFTSKHLRTQIESRPQN